jgi:uncharacterized protein YdaU (DUF1376 family)
VERIDEVFRCTSVKEFYLLLDHYLARVSEVPADTFTHAAFFEYVDKVFKVSATDEKVQQFYRDKQDKINAENAKAHEKAAAENAALKSALGKRQQQPANPFKPTASNADYEAKEKKWLDARPDGVPEGVIVCCKNFAKGEECNLHKADRCNYVHEVPETVPGDKSQVYLDWVATKPYKKPSVAKFAAALAKVQGGKWPARKNAKKAKVGGR